MTLDELTYCLGSQFLYWQNETALPEVVNLRPTDTQSSGAQWIDLKDFVNLDTVEIYIFILTHLQQKYSISFVYGCRQQTTVLSISVYHYRNDVLKIRSKDKNILLLKCFFKYLEKHISI